MDKLWAGRAAEPLDKRANDFNSSIRVDKRMYKQDIEGSIAHATMLAARDIISKDEADEIVSGLCDILNDIEMGKLEIDPESEDIHSFVENELTHRIGDAGRRLHTARSRNDQVALDLRLYLRDEAVVVNSLLKELCDVLLDKAEEEKDTIMPGYTHLQRAQPITFGHQLLSYAAMFLRDKDRIKDAVRRMNLSPLGSCALAGTTYDTDRHMTAELLKFDGACLNSIDGVSDRDFAIELSSALSILMMHLSRLSEEIILYSSFEFGFIELSDAFSTGSSIMPQKKNPDIAELCRGKTGRVYGNLMALLTVMKGLPLAYNKDMQEDKEAVFDSFDTVKMCLSVTAPMIKSMRVKRENMRAAAAEGFINATDCADYLVKKGMPFRTAYKIIGGLVADCINKKTTLEQLPLSEYKNHSELFDESVYEDIALEKCVATRTSFGGTAPECVEIQIKQMRDLNE